MDEKRKQQIAFTLLLTLYAVKEITDIDIANEIIVLMKKLNKLQIPT